MGADWCLKPDAMANSRLQAVEGAVLFALNQGEVCTCQSRLLIQEDIYDMFMEKVRSSSSFLSTPFSLVHTQSLLTP